MGRKATSRGRGRIPRGARARLAALLALALAADAGVSHADAPPLASPAQLTFYWGAGCSHCAAARPFLDGLAAEYPGLVIERVEVRADPAGRARFLAELERLGVGPPVIPVFVVGDHAVVGFRPGHTEAAVRALLDRATGRLAAPAPGGGPAEISLPLLGPLVPGAVSFPVLTVAIGLVDGLNPCAIWVLLVLLAVLLHVRSRGRVLLFGATFVVMSGAVYFLFMTAWTGLFALAGMSRGLTRLLGAALLLVGAVNLKDAVWFRAGPSLVIPDAAKPGLYRRARDIVRAASLPSALAGIAALAFVVNLVELGCTIGLPAAYTRLLTLRQDPVPVRIAYLALYNVAYVVPLGLVVLLYVLTLQRLVLTERGARVLKGISGMLLLASGTLFLVARGGG